jgi:SsrA-binding protein
VVKKGTMKGARAAGLTDQRKILANNKKIRHDYDVLGTYEAGIQLVGAEVKSLRDAKVQLKDSYCRVERDEMWLLGMHISPYVYAIGFGSFHPERPRKILLHRREIDMLNDRMAQDHLSLMPLSIYFRDGKVKIELALAKGRKRHDKRDAIGDRDAKRDIARELAANRKGRSYN